MIKETRKFHYNRKSGKIDIHPFYDDDSKIKAPFVTLSFDEWEKNLACIPIDCMVTYHKGAISIEKDPSFKLPHADKLQNELAELNVWFTKYDLQVAQYQRSLRLSEEPEIKIGDKTYKSIEELDTEAKKNQERIRKIRDMLNR
jgi:hypothetical protein